MADEARAMAEDTADRLNTLQAGYEQFRRDLWKLLTSDTPASDGKMPQRTPTAADLLERARSVMEGQHVLHKIGEEQRKMIERQRTLIRRAREITEVWENTMLGTRTLGAETTLLELTRPMTLLLLAQVEQQ